ncbi:efflux RND transporter periplasmic adaptor subunit [Flavihumibacter cheonanensis]|uniref:efflux RND transporter periplasmic adaptor subunit n=1 Tax=Flavihumibacter cheonanensis TaxID=1442385 RepID=UPI001EF89D11|nr:efflux RND transporter periplasmic adaptor subunit [Flavihumibacter cheonanensis]MCG7750732.1 efflux RND transporter periplasmic adaptor subunit [Flavihumibacter cheonanensis]
MNYHIYHLNRWCTILFTGIAYLLVSCTSTEKPATEEKTNFQVIHPVKLDTSFQKEYVASIQSVQQVEIRSRVAGFIEKILVDEGQSVAAGQVLFQLNSRAFREDLLKSRAQLKSLQAELKAVELELQNAQLLTDKNIISSAEIDLINAKKAAAAAKIEEATAAVSLAELNLSFTQIRAPFAGKINRIPNKTGSLVDEGALLTTLSNDQEVFAYFNLSEKEYLDMQKETGTRNLKVSMKLANGELYPVMGTVETIESEINQASGTLAFRARFSNKKGWLKHGATAKVIREMEVKEVFAIPQRSTFEVQDQLNVYVVDSANRVRIRRIIPKGRLPHLFLVESGISATDRIIYEGVQLAREGELVQPELVKR